MSNVNDGTPFAGIPFGEETELFGFPATASVGATTVTGVSDLGTTGEALSQPELLPEIAEGINQGVYPPW